MKPLCSGYIASLAAPEDPSGVARGRRDRLGEAMRAAFAALPADLQEIYR